MTKKILLGLVAVAVVVGGVAAMSAYEAHVINVTAHIENALTVHPDEIAFGTVFPQEYVERDFTVELSTSFREAERVDDVEYVIRQKPKCICTTEGVTAKECKEGEHASVDYATHECPEYFEEMENLCPFLSKIDADPEDQNDTSHPSYYVAAGTVLPDGTVVGDAYCQQPIRIDRTQPGFSDGGWAGWSCPAGMIAVGGGIDSSTNPVGGNGVAAPGAPAVDGFNYPVYPHYTYTFPEEGYVVHDLVDGLPNTISFHVDCLATNPDATGELNKTDPDLIDLWKVDLKVPPVEGYVGQDWPAGCPTVPTNDVDYGCDLWIEVTNVSETPPIG